MSVDRRRLLTNATLLLAGATSVAATSTKAHGAAPLTRITSIKELRDADPNLQYVVVLGFADASDGGGGLFAWRLGGVEDKHTGVHVASNRASDGHWFRVAYEDVGFVRPEWFGSIQEATDHSTLIQAAIDFVCAEGCGRVDLGSHTYRCASRIILDPTRCILSASGAVLDFTERPNVEAKVLVDLGQLLTTAHGSWAAASGGLTHRPTEFTELRVPLRMQAGARYRVLCEVNELSGDPNNPAVWIGVHCDELENSVAKVSASAPDRVAFEFDWPLDAATGQLVLSCNSDATISQFELQAIGIQECILIRAGADSPQYGHLWLEGFRLRGPGYGGKPMRLHGIRFETKAATKSSRAAIRDVQIDGFETAVLFSDRSYLIHFYNVRLIGDVAVHFLHGSEDAGENISFYGSTIGGNKTAIWNGGSEINLFGCSVNFAEQFYVGVGPLNAQSCHFETNRTTRRDQYLFDVSEGSVVIHANYLMIGGSNFDLGNQAEHIVNLRSPFSSFAMSSTYCYNLRTSTGVFAGGQGRFISRDLSGIALNPIAPIPKLDVFSNLFGSSSSLSEDTIRLDYLLEGGIRDSRAEVATGTLNLQSRDGEGFLVLKRRGPSHEPLGAFAPRAMPARP